MAPLAWYYRYMDDFAGFARLVHEAYAHLHDRAYLDTHPLARLLYGATPGSAERLYRLLVEAVEWLRPLGAAAPSSVEWRRYRHLQLRYLEGASPERIAHELLVSARQARRDHHDALDEVARILWRRRPGAADPSGSTTARAESAVPRRPAAGPGGLDVELSKLAAADAAGPTDVAEVLHGVVQTASRLAEGHGVRIVMDLDEPLSGAAVSRTVLRQVLLNLLTDAIVHHPTGSVRIRASGREGAMDVGIGFVVPASCPECAAGPEMHSEALDVVRRLARSQGIELTVEALHDGVEVRLALPAVAARTLLVVDDNPDIAFLFRRYLADPTCRVVQARSAERAIRLARELQPDVVFLDVLMPSTDGWEILQALRSHAATARLPVVICSVLPDRALALSLGVTDFLSKPVTRAALLDVLARVERPREPSERSQRA